MDKIESSYMTLIYLVKLNVGIYFQLPWNILEMFMIHIKQYQWCMYNMWSASVMKWFYLHVS